jgi:signal transduction histidine kinase
VDEKRAELDSRILIVDDNEENATVVEQILTLFGFTSLKVLNDPSEALDVVEQWDPDLLLLDLHMPGTSGFDILEALRSRLPLETLLPVLVFTADWTMTAKHRAFDLGANDFITKPFDAKELLLRVRNFLRMRQMHLELRERNAKLADTNDALRRSEQSARELAADLKASNRELEGFTHSVSHDLRGPLRSILSTSQMLIEDCADQLSPEGIQLLQRQSANATRLATIIDELLKLSRVTRAPMAVQEVNLTELAADVADEMEGSDLTKNVQFRFAKDMRCQGDPTLVRLVLSNLLGNAVKFSPRGGTIEVGQFTTNDRVTTYVKDEGVGFDPSQSARVFEPFERLVSEKEFPGTGIGLANVKRIVDRHGGKVWAESEPGLGSTFFFTLA